MKKLLLLAVAVAMTISMASAQTFQKGSNVASATLGVAGVGLPINLSYERGVYDINSDMSLGAGAKVSFLLDAEDSFGLGLTAAYHYTGVEKLDLIGGLTLKLVPATNLRLDIGARYYLSDTFGLVAMFDLGNSSGLNLGVCFKF